MTKAHRSAHLIIWLILVIVLAVGLVWSASLRTGMPQPAHNDTLDDAIRATESTP